MISLVPYCPESVLGIAKYVSCLDGKLRRLRVAGYPLDYTKKLLNMFAKGSKEVKYLTPEAPAWPPLPPASVVEHFTSTFNTPVSSFTSAFDGSALPSFPPTPTPTASTYHLDLKRSSSLVEEFQSGLR